MKSANFEILRSGWPELAELGSFAELYAHVDPRFKEPNPTEAGNLK